ncbi:hypothetical protein [Spirosoma aerolatum]|uniref:hypothetical protein n=1 Tax=Spirosoma aerolatum TaxID=1211326 RepID=UPI0012D31D3F|nr:hypothetical protein [Spirosoma aerolatum]
MSTETRKATQLRRLCCRQKAAERTKQSAFGTRSLSHDTDHYVTACCGSPNDPEG